MRAYLAGILTVVVILVLGGLATAYFGLMPAGANNAYFPMERWAAKKTLNANIARGEPQPPYPYGPVTDATLVAGAKGYMANCAVCHGSGVGDESNDAKGQYVQPPQLNKHGVDDDPAGETYWKIENGIRFTGMPSYKKTLTGEQMWQIAYFLKHGTKDLPPAAAAVWNKPHGD